MKKSIIFDELSIGSMNKYLLKYALLLMFTLLCVVLFGQQSSLLKTFLTVEEGLSNNEVTSIVQDKDGFIWIGTRGGLNRYDGYGFKIFNQIPGDSNSLVNPSIESLFVDGRGKIWIGTKSGGVSKYDPETGIFKNIVSNYGQTSNLIPDNRILCFHEDKKGRIWMGTWENGLVIYDQENNTSLKYLNEMVNSIVETSSGQIWVGTENGLFEYLETDNLFKRYLTGQCQEINYDDKRNVLWMVGSNNSGLTKFDLRNYEVTIYKINDPTNPNSIHSYQSLLNVEPNKIWIGTWGTGFYAFYPENESFKRFLIYPETRATLNKDYDAILDIFKDKDGNIWLGTNGGGVCVLTEKLGFKSVGYHPEPNKGLQNTRIMSVVEDSKGNLWLGTIGSGLFWSPDQENFFPVPNNSFSDSRFFIIKYIYEDDDGQIWVGSNNNTFIVKFI
ncbi:MAG TPA: two-component regulator propeller domain-containing protein, partial [Draconibacterium sp.]|nr:two-component regulator propeller domain-containing protein [Draconibacterium sp.]